MLTQDEFRREINAVAVRAAPCDLKDRVMRELRRGSDRNSTHYWRRREAMKKAVAWANQNLVCTLEEGDMFPGKEAFDLFCAAHPEVRKGARPMGVKVFYQALEDDGYGIDKHGSLVHIVGVIEAAVLRPKEVEA